jgi:hypothetical protein
LIVFYFENTDPPAIDLGDIESAVGTQTQILGTDEIMWSGTAIAEFFLKLEIPVKYKDDAPQSIGHIIIPFIISDDATHNAKPAGGATRSAETNDFSIRG